MVDRSSDIEDMVARALCEEKLWPGAFEQETPGNQDAWRSQARAALAVMRFEAARAPNVHIAETIAAMQRAIMANPLYNEKFGGSFVAAFGLANSAFNVLGAAQPSSEAREKEITRLATIEECARMADGWLAIHGGNEIKYTSAREYASDAVADVADAIRGLAHPSRNGEASRFPKTSSDVKPFTPCPGCDGHECDDGCRYPGAISSTTDKTP